MFSTVRLFIKTGLAFLAAGLALGAYLLVRREIGGVFPDRLLVSAHMHAIGVGFVMFLILGVALWLFPRPPKGDTRYRPARILASYWILTVATAGRFGLEIARVWTDAPAVRWAVVAAGLGQVAGLALYFFTMWPRIRSVGSHVREAKGERF